MKYTEYCLSLIHIFKTLAGYENLLILCGHYEGVDERVLEEYGVEEISIGDFVLTGGELPAVILTDAVARMLPGVLSCLLYTSTVKSFSRLTGFTR